MTSSSKQPRPLRGEIWLVKLDPTQGAEIKKTRPVVVLSSDFLDKAQALPIKLVAPIRHWQKKLEAIPSMVPIEVSPANGLSKKSLIDALQLRSIDTNRFVKKLGTLEATELEMATLAVGLVVEYPG
jgi:mRNA interferase MazF